MTLQFFDLEKDTHESFVEKYTSGDLTLRVNTDLAGYEFQRTLSGNEYTTMQAVYRTLFFGGFVGGLIAIFLVGWWSLIMFLIGIIGFRASRRHTDESIIKEALKNPSAFEAYVSAGILAYEA